MLNVRPRKLCRSRGSEAGFKKVYTENVQLCKILFSKLPTIKISLIYILGRGTYTMKSMVYFEETLNMFYFNSVEITIRISLKMVQ